MFIYAVCFFRLFLFYVSYPLIYISIYYFLPPKKVNINFFMKSGACGHIIVLVYSKPLLLY